MALQQFCFLRFLIILLLLGMYACLNCPKQFGSPGGLARHIPVCNRKKGIEKIIRQKAEARIAEKEAEKVRQ